MLKHSQVTSKSSLYHQNDAYTRKQDTAAVFSAVNRCIQYKNGPYHVAHSVVKLPYLYCRMLAKWRLSDPLPFHTSVDTLIPVVRLYARIRTKNIAVRKFQPANCSQKVRACKLAHENMMSMSLIAGFLMTSQSSNYETNDPPDVILQWWIRAAESYS